MKPLKMFFPWQRLTDISNGTCSKLRFLSNGLPSLRNSHHMLLAFRTKTMKASLIIQFISKAWSHFSPSHCYYQGPNMTPLLAGPLQWPPNYLPAFNLVSLQSIFNTAASRGAPWNKSQMILLLCPKPSFVSLISESKSRSSHYPRKLDNIFLAYLSSHTSCQFFVHLLCSSHTGLHADPWTRMPTPTSCLCSSWHYYSKYTL